MAAGSREAYSLISQTMTGDPKTRIAQDTLRKLDELVRKTEEHMVVSQEIARRINE